MVNYKILPHRPVAHVQCQSSTTHLKNILLRMPRNYACHELFDCFLSLSARYLLILSGNRLESNNNQTKNITKPTFSHNLKQGQKSSDVVFVDQWKLNFLGFLDACQEDNEDFVSGIGTFRFHLGNIKCWVGCDSLMGF